MLQFCSEHFQVIWTLAVIACVVFGAIFSYLDKTFWPSENDGLSWMGHSGMVMNMLVIPIVAWIIGGYIQLDWKLFMSLAVGSGVSGRMHMWYANTHPKPNAPGWRGVHVRYPCKITLSGWAHSGLMTMMIASLIYFYTSVNPKVILEWHKWVVAVLIGLDLSVGTIGPSLYFTKEARNWPMIAIQAIAIPAILILLTIIRF